LARYVAKKDESYGWVKRREGVIGETKYAELVLTSQTWRGVKWKHLLFVIRPKSAAPDTKHALLNIAGGSWKARYDEPAGDDDSLPREAPVFAALAEQLKTPIAVLLHVPHQPLFDGKYEDAIIAYTFQQFMKTGDVEWPLLLPMTKSAVRAMDALQEFAKKEWSLDIKTFTVTGASKRGWTTWLTGAVDRRAIAIAPMVIDVLNMAPQMEHQLATWGNYSGQIDDYTKIGLQDQLKSKKGVKLCAIVDPYSYRDRLTQPKLIIIGTNDEYWPLDALSLYWNDLKGEKYILYVPNNGHGIKDYSRVIGSLNALHQQAARGEPLPKLSWEFEEGNATFWLRVKSDKKPKEVRIWSASSPTRDFRKARWEFVAAKAQGDKYVGAQQFPESGYLAVFAEAVYQLDGIPYFLSTNVKIVKSPAEASDSGK